MKVTRITRIGPGLYAQVCPLCGTILASASEPEFMPEFSICNCDRNGNRKEVYELYTEGSKTMIRRNTFPRFTAEVTMGTLSDIEYTSWQDTCTAIEAARAMRKAGEFLLKYSRHKG